MVDFKKASQADKMVKDLVEELEKFDKKLNDVNVPEVEELHLNLKAIVYRHLKQDY